MTTMTAFAAPTRFTPDDVLRPENDGLFELVNHQLVEKHMSSLATNAASIIAGRLFTCMQANDVGRVYIEQTFQCFPHDPDLIRRPDLAFIAANRTQDVPEEGHVPIAPDLAIEIVSANDKVYALDEKLRDYRQAGIPSVWVANPKLRTVRVHRLNKTTCDLQENDILNDELVLPGFSLPVRDLLPPASRA